ncbi:MAG: hypothetical protein JWN41_990 [Thermoleophilia bacterium]|nr:hypothetical protein [Thermoleophilia bacterium]
MSDALGIKFSAEAGARPTETGFRSAHADAKRRRDCFMSQLPEHEEQEHVSLVRTQVGERAGKRGRHASGVEPTVGGRELVAARVVARTRSEFEPSTFEAVVVHQCASRDAIEPRTRARCSQIKCGASRKRHGKDFADDVIGSLRTNTRSDKRKDRMYMPLEHSGEARRTIERCCDQLRVGVGSARDVTSRGHRR